MVDAGGGMADGLLAQSPLIRRDRDWCGCPSSHCAPGGHERPLNIFLLLMVVPLTQLP